MICKLCISLVIADFPTFLRKVEIALGREVGAKTLGVASCEYKLCGVNSVKRTRLVKAGAHAIVGDFHDLDGIIDWLEI